ncbi:hypothetical protein ACFFOM_06800 [Microlunatus capsulatus]|uniref:Uncharacterized protein n=1 Tax=Microlunatus capsulatus TaxID=99117 RepID=A0ABS4Z865_9ACTN|nr:hypothetical protein [Microlunatus capsulatus]MBP2416428.1 hypothetical protein [Microlunatus capsulatus]
MKKLLAGLVVLGTALGPVALLTAPPAAAATRCQGGTGSSRCVTVSNVKKHLKVVESVSLENKSSKKVTMHCSFTKSISRTTTGSISLTAGVKAQVFGVAEASTSIDITSSVSQSASQATTAGGSVVLRSHESVLCQRTYGYVKADVKEVTSTSTKSSTRRYTVTIPVNMGVRVVDL